MDETMIHNLNKIESLAYLDNLQHMNTVKDVFLKIEDSLKTWNQIWIQSVPKQMYKSIFIKSKVFSFMD